MWLSWDRGALLAALFAAAAVLARRSHRWRSTWVGALAAEASLVAGLYSVWQLVGSLPTRTVAAASRNGRWIWHIEQRLHLPSELSMQRLVLGHRFLIEAANGFYAVVHVSALGVFLVWLFLAHRDRYPRYRNALAVLTLLCLVSHLYPVAPPRLLPGIGFVDTALRYHQSVYGAAGAAGISDQVSAMPSVHVAWACLIAVAVVCVSPSRWRWLVVLHPVLTALVIVVTANHFWLDGIAAVGLLAVSLSIISLFGRSGQSVTGLIPHAAGMTITSASPTTTDDPRYFFARAIELGGPVVAAVTPGQMERPTPCTEFDVHQLVRHLVGVVGKVAWIGRGHDATAFPAPEGIPADGWAEAWTDAARDAQAVWSDPGLLGREFRLPFATLPGAAVMAVYTAEVTLHTWDLATATGQTPSWDEAVLATALATMQRALPADNRGPDVPFDAVVPTPDDAPLIDRLVAWNGRQPASQELVGPK